MQKQKQMDPIDIGAPKSLKGKILIVRVFPFSVFSMLVACFELIYYFLMYYSTCKAEYSICSWPFYGL